MSVRFCDPSYSARGRLEAWRGSRPTVHRAATTRLLERSPALGRQGPKAVVGKADSSMAAGPKMLEDGLQTERHADGDFGAEHHLSEPLVAPDSSLARSASAGSARAAAGAFSARNRCASSGRVAHRGGCHPQACWVIRSACSAQLSARWTAARARTGVATFASSCSAA
jgi:hypothetical protein